MNGLKSFFLTKSGAILLAAVLAALSFGLGWLGDHFPRVKEIVDWVIAASGGMVVVTQTVLIVAFAAIAWVQRRTNRINFHGIGVLQDVINSALEQLGKPPVPKDSLFGQKTGAALNELLPASIDIPIDKLPFVEKGTKATFPIAVKLLLVTGAAASLIFYLSGCISLRFPIGKDGGLGDIDVTAKWSPPAEAPAWAKIPAWMPTAIPSTIGSYKDFVRSVHLK